MFVGGFLIDDSDEESLVELGVKDSKKLSNQKRESIRDRLEEFGQPFLREIKASEIDELREIMNLNEIEIKAFTEVIGRTEPDKVIVDLPEPDGDRFIKKMKSELPPRFEDVEFVAEHGADDEYPVVSAASIIAKSARESHIDELKQRYGYDFKSGYSHEQEASDFLEEYLKEHGELPPEARESWETAKRVLREHEQSSMDDF